MLFEYKNSLFKISLKLCRHLKLRLHLKKNRKRGNVMIKAFMNRLQKIMLSGHDQFGRTQMLIGHNLI